MFWRFSGVAAGCILLVVGGPCWSQQANPGAAKSPPAQPAPHTLSPLHAFLGIDPVTGEFISPNAVPARVVPPAAAVPATQSQTKPLDGPPAESTAEPLSSGAAARSSTAPAGGNPAAGSSLRDILARAAESGELPSGDTPIGDTTVDELRAAITKAVDEKDDHALMAAISRGTNGMGYGDLGATAMKYGQLATLALLVYPLGIALGAFFAAWTGRRRQVRTERDRRHDARQLRRRLALALSTAATIGLVWWAGECNFWWNEPNKLLAGIGAVTLLLLFSAMLRFVIRRSANDYSRRTIEDLRCQHAALCEEVKELRRRLQGEGIPETV